MQNLCGSGRKAAQKTVDFSGWLRYEAPVLPNGLPVWVCAELLQNPDCRGGSQGRDQTFTITPNKGYAVAKVLIDSKNVGAVKSYTFENVRRNHTIEVSFARANEFIDVPAGSYFYEAVMWAVENGVTTGISASRFDPDGICTRAQAVTFLWRAAGSPAAKSAVMPFADVKVGSYYYDAVLWAVKEDVTKGTTNTTFSPDANCTRAQIVTFIWRALAE